MNVLNCLRQHPLMFFVICGVLIRLVLAATLTHIYDVASWGLIIENLRAGEGLYDVDQYYYPPVWGYFLEVMCWILDIIPGMESMLLDPWQIAPVPDVSYGDNDIRMPTLIFAFVIKLPLILVDVAISYLLYILVKDITADERKAVMAFGAWMFITPAVMVSSVFGMFDNIAVLMLLISIYFLRKGLYCMSGAALMIGIMTKVYPGIAVFPMIVYLLCKESDRKKKAVACTQFLGSAIIVALILLLPHILGGNLDEVFHFLIYRLNGNGAGGLSREGLRLLVLMAAAVIGALFIPWFISRRNGDATQVMLVSTAFLLSVVIAVYYLQQYVIQVLPLLILLCVAYNSKISKLLSLFALLFLIRCLDEPTMLLPLAECTDLISVDTVVGLEHYLNVDPIGKLVLVFIRFYVDRAIHDVLLLIALVLLIQSIPKWNDWCTEKLQIIVKKIKRAG